MNEPRTTDYGAVAAALEERLRVLQERVARLDSELREPLDPGFGDQATELEDAEAKEGVGQAGRAELALIRAALARIGDGTYGTCSGCGKPIAPARLKALPYADRCIDCADG